MEYRLEQFMEKTYRLNIPMPVVSATELILHVEKSKTYVGKLEVYNSGEGYFMGYVESENGYISIENPVIKGNRCTLHYAVEQALSVSMEPYEETLLITYNGGEIIIPVLLYITEPEEKVEDINYKPKYIEKQPHIETNQRSYQLEETGYLRLFNPSKNILNVKLNALDGYIQFKETEFQLPDYKQVAFSFKVAKIDKILGKIPLKTHPKIEIPFQVVITDGVKEKEYALKTYLTELDTIPTKETITSEAVYKEIFNQLYRDYCDNLFLNKNRMSDTFFEQLKALINYDKTNIELRLLYCYLSIEANKKHLAMKEMNNIDRYLLFYDNEHLEVSDLMLLFIEMIKGESVQASLSRWFPRKQGDWLKILLKNRLLTHHYSSYSDYKALYLMGVKHRLLFTEAVLYLNNNPMIPLEEDPVYKALLTWAIKKKVLSGKWIRKIENYIDQLIRYNNLNDFIAEQLYKYDENKNMLILLCAYYLKANCVEGKAFLVYEKALLDRSRLEGLEVGYVKAAYHCNRLLNLDCFKMSFRVEQLEEPYKSFYLLSVALQKDTYKHLYYNQLLAMEGIKIKCFNAGLMPELVDEQTNYLEFLLKHKQYECIINLFFSRKLQEIESNLIATAIEQIYRVYPEQGIQMARMAYQNGNTHLTILTVLSDHIKGSLGQLLRYHKRLEKYGLLRPKVQEEILFKGILTRKYPEDVLENYVAYYYSIPDGTLHLWVQQYIAAQILIEELQPSYQVILLLEHIAEKEENLPIYLALLKAYTKTSYKNEAIINQLIKALVNKGIIFSWYLQLVPKTSLGERIRIQQFFEYNSVPGRHLYFNYRLDDQIDFSQIEMRHVSLGLYIVHVIMFYNESIQYYIEEVNEEGKRDIKCSDVYIKKDIIELDETESLFDLINTIEISKEMKDALSLEKTVTHYIMMCNKEIDKMNIL